MSDPTVSIGFPVYNGERYLRGAIDSVLAQTYRDFEFIISDNASTDGTGKICSEYAAADPRIRYSRTDKNMGGGWNFNNVFLRSRGKYFVWFCHDDQWAPDFLQKHVDAMERNPDLASCYSRTTFVDAEGAPIYSIVGRPDLTGSDPVRRFREFLRYHTPTNECSQVLGLFRSDVLRKTRLMGIYPSSDMILLGDVCLRGPAYEIPECLLIRRDHPLKSTNAYHSMEERAEWYDPRKKGKIQLATWRWVWEWTRTVLRAPVGAGEKRRSLEAVWRWARFYRHDMKKELRKAVKRILKSTPVIRHALAGR
jgi:glycosyltransferase involved in cell wall biosynthesis